MPCQQPFGDRVILGFQPVSGFRSNSSLARIHVQSVQGAPKSSDTNGFNPGQGGWTG